MPLYDLEAGSSPALWLTLNETWKEPGASAPHPRRKTVGGPWEKIVWTQEDPWPGRRRSWDQHPKDGMQKEIWEKVTLGPRGVEPASLRPGGWGTGGIPLQEQLRAQRLAELSIIRKVLAAAVRGQPAATLSTKTFAENSLQPPRPSNTAATRGLPGARICQ